MAYETEIKIRDSIVHVRVSGERQRGQEANDSLQIWYQVAALCREHQLRGILTILDLAGRLPVTAAYQIATTLESIGLPRNTLIALVDLNAESRQDNLFSETVARNRGFRGQVFSDESEALQWLKEQL